ncbi:hypothetical protein CPB85DRAFT_1565903 [Mucidula mucida]|nr:hypothetical protein CPB85DRAFT_1565903 [Mucidula mucida]
MDSEHFGRLEEPWSKIEPFHTQTRGTRCFVAVDEISSIRDTWRAVYLSESEDSAALDECKGLASVDHSILFMPHPRYIILDPIRTPLANFHSTHALVSYVLHAVLAHRTAYGLLSEANHPQISLGNIVFTQGPEGGRLVGWDFVQCHDDQTIAYKRTSTRHFTAARLCSATPPTHTVGDDVESFVLLLLWMAARFAPNNMTPIERGSALAMFEVGLSKTAMIRGGTSGVVDMKLLSSDLTYVLIDVINKFSWRYKLLDPRDEKNAKVVEELTRQQALLEGHDWFIDILDDASQNEAWANGTDGSRKEQIVERPSRVWISGVDLFQ